MTLRRSIAFALVAVAAGGLLSACGHHSSAVAPLRSDYRYVWTFGLPVKTNETAAFGFATVRDVSSKAVTITGARAAGLAGRYIPLRAFVLKAPNEIIGPIVQGQSYPPPPMAANARSLPYTIEKSDGSVEVVFGLRFERPLDDIRFRGVEIDYQGDGHKMSLIFPVTVRLCLKPRPVSAGCPKPPLSSAIHRP